MVADRIVENSAPTRNPTKVIDVSAPTDRALRPFGPCS